MDWVHYGVGIAIRADTWVGSLQLMNGREGWMASASVTLHSPRRGREGPEAEDGEVRGGGEDIDGFVNFQARRSRVKG